MMGPQAPRQVKSKFVVKQSSWGLDRAVMGPTNLRESDQMLVESVGPPGWPTSDGRGSGRPSETLRALLKPAALSMKDAV